VSDFPEELFNHSEVASLHLSSGQVLAEEGSVAEDVYLIRSGRLLALTKSADGELPLANLGPGDIAGELAVLIGARRNATLRAESECEVVAVPGAAFVTALEKFPDFAQSVATKAQHRQHQTELARFLTGLSREVDASLIEEVEGEAEWRTLAAGQTLFAAGEGADAAYLIANGRLQVVGPDLNSDDTVLAEPGRGELVGEMAIFERAVRNASVRAIRETSLLRLSRAAFDRVLEARPRVMVEIARSILGRTATRPSASQRAWSVAVAVITDLEETGFTSRLVKEIERHGSTFHLWANKVDTVLYKPGISQVGPGDGDEARLSHFLHEVESQHQHLVIEADRAATPWSRRALRHADRVLLVISPNPDEAEEARIRQFLAALHGADHVAVWLAVVHPSSSDRPSGSAGLVARFGAGAVFHLHQGSLADANRLARTLTSHGVGLVLGGGGARGFAHIGVYRAMTELGIPVDLVGGSSIGAVLAACIARGFPPDELVPTARRQFVGLLDYTIPLVSLAKGKRISRSLAEVFGGWDIEDLWLPYFCASTNLTRSRTETHRRGDLAQAVRASVAIPGVLPPVPFGEDLLVDGGVLDNLPIEPMRRTSGVGTVLAVDVAPPIGPRAKTNYGLSVSGWRALQSKVKKGAPQFPGITAVLLRTMIVSSMRVRDAQVARGDADLYLDLDMRKIGMLDFEVVERVVEAGYQAALPRLEAWLAGSE
jgi:predicted acylesterase/phospholipase RssA/CRP-like cAMP-binding protein